jgi:hypothetical protein
MVRTASGQGPFLPPEDCLARLHRSGWACREVAFTGSSGRVV